MTPHHWSGSVGAPTGESGSVPAGTEDVRHSLAYMMLGGLTGLIAPGGLLVYGAVAGAPDPVVVVLCLIIGGVAALGAAGWVIGRRDDALAARNRELAALSEQLRTLSVTDALTGLPNRRAFDERLALEVAVTQRYGRSLAVVMIDLDRFKETNDRYGHAAGDEVLRAVAAILDRQRRSVDLVARFGGEEFVAILPHADRRAAGIWAERVRRAIAAYAAAHPHATTASFGVAELSQHGMDGMDGTDSGEALVAAADAALYRAKHAGRDRVEVAAGSVTVESSALR
jgi:diguanylate cyclase (GGDEF)-like protein